MGLKFKDLSECYFQLEKTKKKLEMVDILAAAIVDATAEEIGKISLLTLGKIYPDFVGIELMLAEKMAIKSLAIATGKSDKSVSQMLDEVGDLGKTAYSLLQKKPQSTLLAFTDQKELIEYEVVEIWEILVSIAQMSGEGSSDKKIRTLSGLIAKISPLEAKYVIRMVCGQLRLGVASQLLLEALSLAKTGTRENKNILERANNRCSDIGFVAETLYRDGIEAVRKIVVKIFSPVRVMLAQRVSSSDELLERFGGHCSLEYKYDGLRVQIHKKGKEVKLFSRRPEEITNQFPDVIQFIQEASIEDEYIIEGEIVAFDQNLDKILPFQQVSQRKRKHDVLQKASEIPVRVYLFDALYCFNESKLDLDYLERRELLDKIVKKTDQIQFSHQILASTADDIDKFFFQALENSCEGIMGKSVSKGSVYQAGARGWNWVKYKADYVDKLSDSFDLVILGADYGKGKRAGKYGSFLLGCFEPEEGVYQTFTWVATGFSDEDLDQMFKELKPLEREKPKEVDSVVEPTVWFDPKIVIEVSGAEITVSQMHTCSRMHLKKKTDGLALRFPRFSGKFVDDRPPEQATSSEEIRTIYLNQKNK